MRPVIGISSYVEPATWGAWGEVAAALVPQAYVSAVARGGGRPVVLPPLEDAVPETLDVLDGLVLTGGSDLDPSIYGQEPHAQTVRVRRERDRAELGLLQGALERDVPLLAICRGMQLLNVACGGDLHQHLPELVGHDAHKVEPGRYSRHAVSLAPGSRVGSLLGKALTIPSHHHQGLDRIGAGLTAVGWADDGSVEAVEDPARRFVLGVLWHPEDSGDDRLFEALVEAGRAFGAARGG